MASLLAPACTLSGRSLHFEVASRKLTCATRYDFFEQLKEGNVEYFQISNVYNGWQVEDSTRCYFKLVGDDEGLYYDPHIPLHLFRWDGVTCNWKGGHKDTWNKQFKVMLDVAVASFTRGFGMDRTPQLKWEMDEYKREVKKKTQERMKITTIAEETEPEASTKQE